MVQRRPLVLVSGALSQLPPGDTLLVPSGTYSDIVAGSGLVGGGSIANNIRLDVALASAASGLVFTSDNKLSLDGYAEVTANAAIASGNAALVDVQAAQASGNAALLISVEALASGNAALLANLSGIQLSTAAIQKSTVAYASGQAALTRAASVMGANLNAIASGEYAYGSGVAANQDSVEALSSGNAALNLLAANPFLSSEELVGLIFALA